MTVRGQGRSLQHGASKYHGGRSVYTPRSAISATLREKSLAKGFLLENVSTDALYPAFYLKKNRVFELRFRLGGVSVLVVCTCGRFVCGDLRRRSRSRRVTTADELKQKYRRTCILC